MERLIFHVDVNSAFLSWEAARRVKRGEPDLRLMPFIGLLTGGVNFNEKFIILKLPEGIEASQVTYGNASELGVAIWGYGAFITAIINFLIMALIVFFLVKGINRLSEIGKKEEKEAEPTTKKCPHCCEEVNINATKCPHCTGDIPAEE